MNDDQLNQARTELFERIRASGTTGLGKSKLGLTSKVKQAAFKALIDQKSVLNMGTSQKTQYVVKEHYHPLAAACDKILGLAAARGLNGSTVRQLTDKVKGAPGKEAEKAIDWLVKEKKLMQIRCAGRGYYLNTEVVRRHMPAESQNEECATLEPPKDSDDLEERIIRAYEKIKDKSGFPDVRIFYLHQESGVPMPELKEFLNDMARLGKVVFSQGDWSLASENVRSGAVEIHGKPYLMVRFYM